MCDDCLIQVVGEEEDDDDNDDDLILYCIVLYDAIPRTSVNNNNAHIKPRPQLLRLLWSNTIMMMILVDAIGLLLV
jgi:hypothetical protein